MKTREQIVKALVDKFLTWPLPESVCSDLCATKQGYPHRSGTTLLSAVEAKQMIEYLLADLSLYKKTEGAPMIDTMISKFLLKFPGGRAEHEFYRCDDVDTVIAALRT